MAPTAFQGKRPRWQYTLLGLAVGIVTAVAASVFVSGLASAAVLAIIAGGCFAFTLIYERWVRRTGPEP